VVFRDFPNAWAPLQHMIIEGLVMSGSRKARAMAQTITHSWLQSNYMAFQRWGHMVEKYDSRYCGEVGGGGEYTIQVSCLALQFSSTFFFHIRSGACCCGPI
jgi:alpha,alpha-trehalase